MREVRAERERQLCTTLHAGVEGPTRRGGGLLRRERRCVRGRRFRRAPNPPLVPVLTCPTRDAAQGTPGRPVEASDRCDPAGRRCAPCVLTYEETSARRPPVRARVPRATARVPV